MIGHRPSSSFSVWQVQPSWREAPHFFCAQSPNMTPTYRRGYSREHDESENLPKSRLSALVVADDSLQRLDARIPTCPSRCLNIRSLTRTQALSALRQQRPEQCSACRMTDPSSARQAQRQMKSQHSAYLLSALTAAYPTPRGLGFCLCHRVHRRLLLYAVRVD